MKKIYAAFITGQFMCYAFTKSELDDIIKDNGYEALGNETIEFEVDDAVAERIKDVYKSDLDKVCAPLHKTPEKYIEQARESLERRLMESVDYPEEHKPKNRTAVFFNNAGKLIWSPSLNNLNGFYERNPKKYLGQPKWIEIPWSIYIANMARFEYECDRF